MITSLITIFLAGLTITSLAIPLMRRKVKMNSWYGIRLPQTMANENVWYEVNEKVGRYIFFFGLFICALTVLVFFYPIIDEIFSVYILLAALALGSILLIVVSINYAKKFSE